MTWPVRSSQLYWEHRGAISAGVKYYSGAVPSGKKWLVKDICLYQNDSSGATAYIWVNISGTDSPIANLIPTGTYPVVQTVQRSIVLNPGDKIGYGFTVSRTGADFLVCGAVLG